MVFYQGNVFQIASLSLGDPYQFKNFSHLTNNFNSKCTNTYKTKLHSMPLNRIL